MREQQAQIIEIIQGPTELFVEAFQSFRPQQHDAHCKGWRWNLYLEDAKRREAAVREEARKIIKAVNDRKEQLAALSRAYAEAAE